jgi:hypothetical protein
MRRKLFGKAGTKGLLAIFLAVFCLGGCASSNPSTAYRSSTVIVKRAGTLLDDGMLYVYVDGNRINANQPIGKGQTRNFTVSNGFHRIKVMADSLESGEAQFTVENSTASFNVSTERIGGSKVLLLERAE